jgi:hypothetical protein
MKDASSALPLFTLRCCCMAAAVPASPPKPPQGQIIRSG